MRREKAADLYQKCKAEEEELLRCLEETRRKRELAANLARPSLVQKDQPLSVLRGSTDDRRSLDGISLSDSERNASIREWLDASGVNSRKEATSTIRINSRNNPEAYASGVRWEDLDAMEKSVIEARPTSNAPPKASFYDTTSQPVPASAPLAARTSGGFMRDLNQTVTNETELAIANVRQLRPEQLVARRYLPKELPTFAGDPSDWPKFISAYVESQAHCNYSRRENMMRLKPALKGDALRLVEDLLNFPDNLDRVINSLRSTYGHPDKIRNAIVGKLRALPPVGTDDLEGITRLANKVLGYSSTLQSAQLHGDLYNPDYVTELERKLPAHIRLSWGMHKRTSGSSLSAFAEWLFEVGEAAGSLGEPYRPKPAIQKRPVWVHTHSVPPKPAPEKSKQGTASKSRPDCEKCNGRHTLAECGDFKDMDVNQRWELARSKRLCFRCLEGHSFFSCRNKATCDITGCKRKHHKLLHKEDKTHAKSNPETSRAERLNHHDDKSTNALFRIVPVQLYGTQGKVVRTYAFLDEGSSVTLVEDEILRSLGVEGPREELCLQWTGATRKTETTSRRVSLGISATTESNPKIYTLSDVRSVKTLDLPIQTLSRRNIEGIQSFKYLPIPDYHQAQPKILIGLAHWRLAVPIEHRESEEGWIASKTRLGWTVSGVLQDQNSVLPKLVYHIHECGCFDNRQLERAVQRYFELENCGIQSPPAILESKDVQRARRILKETTRCVGERFETGLLWRTDVISLPNSKKMAERRLRCFEMKLAKDEALYENVRTQMRHYLNQGYIRELNPREAETTTTKTWYLPIFTVANPNKPDKVRIVWDAAAKVDGISLNDILLPGPDFLCALPDILRRFREYQVAVTGDITEMFHQVKVRDSDQDAQRFLWRDSPEEPLKTMVMCVMTFGATCSPSTAQYVKNMNAERYRKRFPEAVYDIQQSHYVDDYVASYKSTQIASRVSREVAEIQSKAGFKLCKFNSNSKVVLLNLEPAEGKIKDLSLGNGAESKVLGLRWDAGEDVLYFKVNWLKLVLRESLANIQNTKMRSWTS